MFKIIGLIIAYFISPDGFWWTFFFMLMAWWIGGFIDRIRAIGANPLKVAIRRAVFLETLFTLMGRLAKVDGHISQDEIDHAEVFMRKLGMQEQHRQQAITWFKKGASTECDVKQVCTRFNNICGKTRDLKQMLVINLIVMAHSDDAMHQSEQQLLIEISQYLGFNAEEFQRLLDMVRSQSHFAGGQVNQAQALEDAYKALGMTEQSSDAEIKRAYRKLMSQYHPDKLMGQGMPEDMIATATEQAKEVQLAYDLIKKHRGT